MTKPAGTTHQHPTNNTIKWFKKVDGVWHYWSMVNEQWKPTSHDCSDLIPADEGVEPIPEHTRQALLMVLYCHQGAHSRIGQEVRFILGKGQYESMTPDEVRIAGEMLTKVVTE